MELTQVPCRRSISRCFSRRLFLLRYKTPRNQNGSTYRAPHRTYRTSPRSPENTGISQRTAYRVTSTCSDSTVTILQTIQKESTRSQTTHEVGPDLVWIYGDEPRAADARWVVFLRPVGRIDGALWFRHLSPTEVLLWKSNRSTVEQKTLNVLRNNWSKSKSNSQGKSDCLIVPTPAGLKCKNANISNATRVGRMLISSSQYF